MTKNKTSLFLSILATLTLIPASLAHAADDQNPTTSAAQTQMSNDRPMSQDQMKDAVVLNQIHHINQKEIQLSQMAVDRTQANDVKTFAQHMITDHQNADQKVQALANSKNITLKDFQPADYEKVAMDNLSMLQGTQFDRAFIASMKAGHKHALFDLETASADSKDPQIKSLIKQLEPTVKAHEKMASNIKVDQEHQMAGELNR